MHDLTHFRTNLDSIAEKLATRGFTLDVPSFRELDSERRAALTEVDMDATLTGDYRPLMQFLNGLERSRTFFMVNSITLSGQQSGTVNLRMRLLTYLRSPKPGEAVNDSPTSGDTADSGEKP